MYFGEAPTPFNEFTLIFHNQNGKAVFQNDELIPDNTFINLTAYMKEHNIAIDHGLLNIVPQKGLSKVANYAHFKIGFIHQNNPYLTTNVAGGNMNNTSFDYKGGTMWKHAMLPVVNSEQFGRVVSSKEYDTIVTIINSSSRYKYDDKAQVEVYLYSWDGKPYRFELEILPNSSNTFSVSELLKDKQIKSERDYFSIWFNCRTNYIRGYHLLHRKADDAIGVEHFYYGRFNAVEAAKDKMVLNREFVRNFFSRRFWIPPLTGFLKKKLRIK